MFTARVIDRKTKKETYYECKSCVYIGFDKQLLCRPQKKRGYLPFLWCEFDNRDYIVEIIY